MTYINKAVVWIKKTKTGKSYLSVKLEQDFKKGDTFNLFTNDKGDNPSRPDYRAYEKVEDEATTKATADSDEVADSIPF